MGHKINFDKYIASAVKNNPNGISIRVDIHNNKNYFDTLINWLAPRGYTWKDGSDIFSFSPYSLDYVKIFPSDGYLVCGHNRGDNIGYRVDFIDLDLSDNTQKIVYISGAISGTHDFFKRFGNAEKDLESMGYTVVNPAKINSFLPTTTTWEQYMEIDYKILDICNTIYMLNGWELSRGAKAEHQYAIDHDIDIMYQPKELLIKDVSTLCNDEIKIQYNDDESDIMIGKHYITKEDAKKLYDWLGEVVGGVKTDDI